MNKDDNHTSTITYGQLKQLVRECRTDEGLRSALGLGVLAGLTSLGGIVQASDDGASIPQARQEQQVSGVVRARYGGYTPDQALNILTRTIFVEGRGETPFGRKMIATTIWNRAGGRTQNMAKACLAKGQYSCWRKMTDDERSPAGFKIRKSKGAENNATWDECERIAVSMLDGQFESLGNYNSYQNPDTATADDAPAWLARMQKNGSTKIVGNHVFGYLPEHDGFKKQSLKEHQMNNTKITLTMNQLKRLIRESSCCGKSSVQRLSESDSYDSDTDPRVYVGTYGKYNDGSLKGEWVDLADFDSYDDFMDYIHELHSDEKDPEFMFQDYENFPKAWYSESSLDKETFDKIKEYADLSEDEREAYECFVDDGSGDDSIEAFHEMYEGDFDTPQDFAANLVDELGWEGLGQDNLNMHFDFDEFGRDLFLSGDFHRGDSDNEDIDGEPEDEGHYYDNDGYDMGEYRGDGDVAETFVDDFGGIENLHQDTLINYFDYNGFARDLLMTDYWNCGRHYFRRY